MGEESDLDSGNGISSQFLSDDRFATRWCIAWKGRKPHFLWYTDSVYWDLFFVRKKQMVTMVMINIGGLTDWTVLMWNNEPLNSCETRSYKQPIWLNYQTQCYYCVYILCFRQGNGNKMPETTVLSEMRLNIKKGTYINAPHRSHWLVQLHDGVK